MTDVAQRVAASRSRLEELASLLVEVYPWIYESDQARSELATRTQPGSRVLFDPKRAPVLHRAYVDACKHAVRCGTFLATVTDAPFWYSAILTTPRPSPPHPRVAHAGCLVNAAALGTVKLDELSAVERAAVTAACNEADAALDVLARKVTPKPGKARKVDPPCVHCEEKPPERYKRWCQACRRRHERGACGVCGLGKAA